MRILLLTPEPFYQDRGTPIAVALVLRVLSERGEEVDVVTYHEGRDVSLPNVTLHRIANLSWVRGVRPGFSWKKVLCDVFVLLKAIRLAARRRYHLVHAVEEAVFIALLLKWLFKVPYVYDMDSLLSQQLAARFSLFSFAMRVLAAGECLALRQAKAVLPVCESLAAVATRFKTERIVLLPDVSLLEDTARLLPEAPRSRDSMRGRLGIRGLVLMYVGNLEPYQGIDLLLESFALVLRQTDHADLVIIGGTASDIDRYRAKGRHLGIAERVHFLGPRSIHELAENLAAADVVVSPRLQGNNTPMKLYSYLHSGKAVVATDLPTHTQLVDASAAMLAAPTPEAFACALIRVIEDEGVRSRLGAAGRRLVEDRFTYRAFRANLNGLLDWLETETSGSQYETRSQGAR